MPMARRGFDVDVAQDLCLCVRIAVADVAKFHVAARIGGLKGVRLGFNIGTCKIDGHDFIRRSEETLIIVDNRSNEVHRAV